MDEEGARKKRVWSAFGARHSKDDMIPPRSKV